jgi:hypothetical protein
VRSLRRIQALGLRSPRRTTRPEQAHEPSPAAGSNTMPSPTQIRRSLPSALRSTALVAPLLLGLGLVQSATAGCLDVPGLKPPASAGGKFVQTDYRPSWDEENPFVAPIVGLWTFKYISEGNAKTYGIPDGAEVDAGVTTWYADGNEITYSGVRNPTVGAFCAGVWKRTGEETYVLNHIGLSWNPLAAPISPPQAPGPAGPGNPGGGPGAPGGPAFIKQYITLSKDHQSYSGTFTINQLEVDGKTSIFPTPIKGKITAVRLTVDSTTDPIYP